MKSRLSAQRACPRLFIVRLRRPHHSPASRLSSAFYCLMITRCRFSFRRYYCSFDAAAVFFMPFVAATL